MMNIKDLNIAQQGELIENFVEIVVDNMSTESLVVYAQEQLKDYYSKLSYRDLEEEINEYDEELLEELIDNETNETLISWLLWTVTKLSTSYLQRVTNITRWMLLQQRKFMQIKYLNRIILLQKDVVMQKRYLSK